MTWSKPARSWISWVNKLCKNFGDPYFCISHCHGWYRTFCWLMIRQNDLNITYSINNFTPAPTTQMWNTRMNTEKSIFYFLHFRHSKKYVFLFILRFQFSHPFMLSNEFIFIYMAYKTECNLSSKDSTTTDDSIDYIACSSKCLNDLNNIELCSCHQNNEIGKEKCLYFSYYSDVRHDTV